MIFRNVIWVKGKFGAVAVLMTPLDTIGSQARDAKMILGVRIIMMMGRIWVMAMTIMVIAMQDMEYGRWWRKMLWQLCWSWEGRQGWSRHHLDIIESHAREGKHLEISLMAISKNADSWSLGLPSNKGKSTKQFQKASSYLKIKRDELTDIFKTMMLISFFYLLLIFVQKTKELIKYEISLV